MSLRLSSSKGKLLVRGPSAGVAVAPCPGRVAYHVRNQRHSAAQCSVSARSTSISEDNLPAPFLAAPGVVASIAVLLVRGPVEQGLIQANDISLLSASFLFLSYFWASLTQSRNSLIAKVATSLKAHSDSLLYACTIATGVQVALAAALCLRFPQHGEGALVPLYVAGYLCLGVLAASQRKRPLKGRVRMEIEAGEGERHSVMAQGGRLAMRDYLWGLGTVHLAAQAAAGAAAATAAAASGAAGPVGCATAVAYGVAAVLFAVAGALKYLPGLQGGREQQAAA